VDQFIFILLRNLREISFLAFSFSREDRGDVEGAVSDRLAQKVLEIP